MDTPHTFRQEEMARIYDRQADTVYRVCFLYLKNPQDAADLTQSTFLRLLQRPTDFRSPEHEKAWLIVTAGNLCKDFLRHWWRRIGPLEAAEEAPAPQDGPSQEDALQLREALLALPERYRLPLYLFYYEGYSTGEIAGMLHKKESTVRSLLHRGREQLRDKV